LVEKKKRRVAAAWMTGQASVGVVVVGSAAYRCSALE
jgi:hypothetical protein